MSRGVTETNVCNFYRDVFLCEMCLPASDIVLRSEAHNKLVSIVQQRCVSVLALATKKHNLHIPLFQQTIESQNNTSFSLYSQSFSMIYLRQGKGKGSF